MKKWIFVIGILTFLISQNSFAYENQTSLDTIVVTASRYKESIKETPMNIQVIGPEEIEASSARDLGELLSQKGIGTIRQ